MSILKEQLLGALSEIKGNGSFLSTGDKSFVFPGLEIQGVGEIGFPVNHLQIAEMVKAAHKAPFGKGSETVLDTTVRSAWEIDADKTTFNSDWGKFVDTIVGQIKPGLGIADHVVSANLYKLLIYEKGDFFLPHKDSEKEKGMFGTLIIGLPSKHTGGELIVKFDGRTETVDFSEASSTYKIPFAAFYADCEHQIVPITSGYRVCLVYNLVQNDVQDKIQFHQVGGHANKLAEILKTCEEDRDIPKIVLLGHQYTPSNFTMDMLKLNDRPKVEALMLAAQKANFYAKLGLVTSYQTGDLEMNYDSRSSRSRSRRSYYDDFDDYDGDELAENGTMGEIYDEHVDVEHWMQEGVPPLRNINFDEEDLISVIKLNEGDPIEKQAEGYTGNAGMEMTYWYHYGAVFLWPKKYQYEMLTDLTAGNMMEWLAYYNKHWDVIDIAEKDLIKRLVAEDLAETDSRTNLDYSPLADWLINLKDERYLAEEATTILVKHFSRISIECWVKLFETYAGNYFEKVFATAGLLGQPAVAGHLLIILNQLSADAGIYGTFVMNQTNQVPAYLDALNLSDKDVHTTAKEILRNVLKLSALKQGDNTWGKKTTEAFTKSLTREYVNDVLASVVLEFGKGLALAKQIIAICKEDLVNRVENKPQPPVDWTRPLPRFADHYKNVWAILTEFLQSPTQQVFDYQKVQAERSAMESAIMNVTIDLRLETIRKGSPHTLRLTKTQGAYKRELAKWEADVVLLEKVTSYEA